MSGQNTFSLLSNFIRLHWFKISLVAFLLFLIFRKNFSFTINLNAPIPTEIRAPSESQPIQQETPVKRETFTEQVQSQSITPAPEKGVLDRFDFSSIIGGADKVLQKALYQLDPESIEQYIKRFGRVARSEQQKFGIPASITIANALLHSQAGKTKASMRANNHFGIPCTSDWMGEKWNPEGQCLRAYENAWTSFRDHSFYITTGHFAELRQIAPQNYKAWAKALEEKDFAHTEDLEEQLIEIIEKWRLFELD